MKTISEINNIHEYFDELHQRVVESEFIDIKKIENINGFYVFYEENEAQYVGRTNQGRMKKRLEEHSARYSNQNSATFAFRIAKKEKDQPELKTIATYDDVFVKAKNRVGNMKIKVIEVNNPIIQTMFEPYLAFKLKTLVSDGKYNDFNTH